MVDELESVEEQSDEASTYFGVVVGVIISVFFEPTIWSGVHTVFVQMQLLLRYCLVWFCFFTWFVFFIWFYSVLLFGKQVVDISIRIG